MTMKVEKSDKSIGIGNILLYFNKSFVLQFEHGELIYNFFRNQEGKDEKNEKD